MLAANEAPDSRAATHIVSKLPITPLESMDICITTDKTYVDQSAQIDMVPYSSLPHILNSDEKLKHFTGIDIRLLQTLEKCCENILSGQNKTVADLKIKIMIVLLNLPLSCLAILFNISPSKCNRYFYSSLSLLALSVKPCIYWPSKEEVRANMPKCFSSFANTRAVLDCIDVAVDKCKCLNCSCNAMQ